MKLAVISDLHGNYYALAKVLAFLRSQEIDGIIGLGDFVTDGPFPQRMMRVLREMQEEFPCYLVRGNREEYLLENIRHPQNWKAGSSTSGLLDYTFRNLTDAGKQHMADRMFSDSLRSRRLPRRIRPRRAGNAWQCPCPFLKTDIDLRRELFLSHRKTSA